MSLLVRLMARAAYPHAQRVAPPAEPPQLEDLAETVQVVTSRGRWQPEPGAEYVLARELPMPGPHDPRVFGPEAGR